MTVKELIKELEKLPQDIEVVAKVNNTGFNGMAGTVSFARVQKLSKHPYYSIWSEHSWSEKTPRQDIVVLL